MKSIRPFRLGCGEWGFRELPIERHFEIAREFGFRFLEFGIGGDFPGRLDGNLSDAEIRNFRELARNHEMATPFACVENDFTLPDAREHAALLDRTLDEIRLAARLGARQVRLFAGFTPLTEMTPAIWERMREAFERCDELCESLDLTIAIETHGRILWREQTAHHLPTVSTDPESLRRLIEQLPARIGFNFDPGNLKAVDPDDRDFRLGILNERIHYCHLKDWKRCGDGWVAVAIGDDDLDYGQLLPRMRYSGGYLIEYEPVEDVEAGIRRSLEYLQRIGIQCVFE